MRFFAAAASNKRKSQSAGEQRDRQFPRRSSFPV
jgi:hypothetical protein